MADVEMAAARGPQAETDIVSRISVLRTPRLMLAPFQPADAEAVFVAITPGLTRFMGWEPPPSREAFANVWGDWPLASAAGTDQHFVVRAACGAFLGMAGLHGIGEPEPELGIWIAAASHGHGFGREAVAAVMAWASLRLKVDAFLYPVADANAPSRRLAESLGGLIVGSRAGPKFNEVVYRISRRCESFSA